MSRPAGMSRQEYSESIGRQMAEVAKLTPKRVAIMSRIRELIPLGGPPRVAEIAYTLPYKKQSLYEALSEMDHQSLVVRYPPKFTWVNDKFVYYNSNPKGNVVRWALSEIGDRRLTEWYLNKRRA